MERVVARAAATVAAMVVEMKAVGKAEERVVGKAGA